MEVRPGYRLLANGGDITATIQDRLKTLAYTDEAGLESDVLEIVLADHITSAPIQLPPTGAELRLSIGYDKAYQEVGLFAVDELELSGPPDEMTIRARAAIQDATPAGKTSLRGQKTRAWTTGTTLGAMVSKIAGEHGMGSAVSSDLASIALPHTAQTDESDLNLLIRMARKFDAVVKPAGGKIVLAKRGAARTVSGAAMPAITLTRGDVTSWRLTTSKRESAGEVVAYWHDVANAKRHEVKAGSGEPVHRLKTQYPTKAMALAAARAELRRRDRGKTTLSVTLPGNPAIVAEGALTMAGFRPGIDGQWVITRAIHAIADQGYVTTVEAETPSGDDKSETDTAE